MKELSRFKEFLNEDIEEGLFDTIAGKLFKDTPKEDPTPEDVPAEPKLPEWVLMAFTSGPNKGLHTVFEMEKFQKGMKAKHNWINSPSDYLEILGKIPNAEFAGIPASLGKEIFDKQQKDKSKSLLGMGLKKEKVMDILGKLVKPVKGNLDLPMLGVNSLEDLKEGGINESRDEEVDNMKDNLVEYIGAEALVEALIAAMSTYDAKLYLSAIMRDYDLGGMEMNESVDDGLDRLVDAFEKLDDVAKKAFMKLIGK
jgi:hypothetical protein